MGFCCGNVGAGDGVGDTDIRTQRTKRSRSRTGKRPWTMNAAANLGDSSALIRSTMFHGSKVQRTWGVERGTPPSGSNWKYNSVQRNCLHGIG